GRARQERRRGQHSQRHPACPSEALGAAPSAVKPTEQGAPVSLTLYYHPYSRAAGTLIMLEELGLEYELRTVDLMKGELKTPAMLAINPTGKLPILDDGGVIVTESAAIALYLADRYSLGELAPAFDDPARATYLRWALFSPSVIEPAIM